VKDFCLRKRKLQVFLESVYHLFTFNPARKGLALVGIPHKLTLERSLTLDNVEVTYESA